MDTLSKYAIKDISYAKESLVVAKTDYSTKLAVAVESDFATLSKLAPVTAEVNVAYVSPVWPI